MDTIKYKGKKYKFTEEGLTEDGCSKCDLKIECDKGNDLPNCSLGDHVPDESKFLSL